MKKVYPRDQKERVLRKLLELGDGGDAPEGAITKLSNAEGIPPNTLYTWNASLKRTGAVGKFSASGNPSVTLSSKAKYEIVLRTESMTELEFGTYLREQGILAEDLERWKVACQEANDRSSIAAKEYRANLAAQRAKVIVLERELARKEKALAETAALLVLRGKAQALWGDRGD